MKNLVNIFYILIGVIILFCIAAFVFFSLKIAFQITRELNETQKTLFVVTITLTAPIIGNYLSNRQSKLKDFELRNREKKEKAYDDFVSLLFKYIEDESNGGKDKDQNQKKLLEVRKNLIVWGSDDVVKTYSDFMKYSQNLEQIAPVEAASKASSAFENIIKSIRKDLGYKNQKFISEDISRYFR